MDEMNYFADNNICYNRLVPIILQVQGNSIREVSYYISQELITADKNPTEESNNQEKDAFNWLTA